MPGLMGLRTLYGAGRRGAGYSLTKGAGWGAKGALGFGAAMRDPALRTATRGAGIGAGMGGAYGMFSDDTSFIGGAFGGALMGAAGGMGARYGGMALRKGWGAAGKRARGDLVRLANRTDRLIGGSGKAGSNWFGFQAARSRRLIGNTAVASNQPVGSNVGARAAQRMRGTAQQMETTRYAASPRAGPYQSGYGVLENTPFEVSEGLLGRAEARRRMQQAAVRGVRG